MSFARTASALDRLADALRRSDASWAGGVPVEWEELSASDRAEWRVVAYDAATAVSEEITVPAGAPVRDVQEGDHPRPVARPR